VKNCLPIFPLGAPPPFFGGGFSPALQPPPAQQAARLDGLLRDYHFERRFQSARRQSAAIGEILKWQPQQSKGPLSGQGNRPRHLKDGPGFWQAEARWGQV
jgi:hypothetical protein